MLATSACETSRSNGGPKINVSPDLPSVTPRSSGAASSDSESGTGIHSYPATPTGAPPVAPPTGKGRTILFEPKIVVDQFGYRPDMKKVAVLVDPVNGWNGREAYRPPAKMEVRKWSDGSSVFSGGVTQWKGGAIDEASGDRGYWFDFSSLTAPGLYYVYDPEKHVRSHPFKVAKDVYRDVLIAATKMFYFNRANVAKKAPYACQGTRCWELGADNIGAGQDTEAHSIRDRNNPKTSRDLRGGWWDAGDTNKYVTFSLAAVHKLLSAYEENPKAFSDDFGIPESGNGIPDVLDELKVEFDWLKRMQPADLKGGVILKVGNADGGDPIPDESRFRRYYYPGACSSSTIVAASEFAHGAVVFSKLNALADYAKDLEERAKQAYDHYEKNPKSDACDDGSIKSGDADSDLPTQEQHALVAAVYLYALTGDAKYDKRVRENYQKSKPFVEDRWSVYDACQGDALLFYAGLPNADGGTKKAILDRKKAQANSVEFYKFVPDRDLYRAYMRADSYHWGSNRQRANFANTNYDMIVHKLAPGAEVESYRERAAGILHYFHGVNPMQITYLTNMYGVGGDACADEMFHTWFRDGSPLWDNARTSKFGPAPGYLTGGPNAQYCKYQSPDNACTKGPVREQPIGKAYVDTNLAWDPASPFDKAWELTEPGIYYQAAYVRLVSKFVD